MTTENQQIILNRVYKHCSEHNGTHSVISASCLATAEDLFIIKPAYSLLKEIQYTILFVNDILELDAPQWETGFEVDRVNGDTLIDDYRNTYFVTWKLELFFKVPLITYHGDVIS